MVTMIMIPLPSESMKCLTSPSWDLHETHDLVRKRFDRKQELLVRECTRSIVDCQRFGHFYYQEVLRLAKSFERK